MKKYIVDTHKRILEDTWYSSKNDRFEFNGRLPLDFINALLAQGRQVRIYAEEIKAEEEQW